MRNYWVDSKVKYLGIILLAAVYALVAKLVLMFFAANHVVSVIWPPSGIALAVLLVGGKRFWPGVLLGAFLGNLWAGSALLVSLVIACGNTMEAVVGCYLLRAFDTNLKRPEDYLRLLVAGGLASLVAAGIGATVLIWHEVIASVQFLSTYSQWWMGDVLGIATVAPLIMVWRQSATKHWSLQRLVLAVLCMGMAFLAGQIIFLEWPFNAGTYGKAHYLYLFLAVIALIAGLQGVLLLLGMVMLQSMFGVSLKVGYFAHESTDASMFMQWSFLMVMTIVGISLALVIERHQRSEAAAKSLADFNRQILQSIQEGLVVHSPDGRVRLWNRFMENLSGIPQADCLHKSSAEVLPWAGNSSTAGSMQKALQGEVVRQGTFYWAAEKQTAHWIDSVLAPLRNESGQSIGVIELVSDVTQRIQSDQSLSASELRFKSILDNTPTVIFCKNPDGTYLLINRQYEKLFGITDAAFKGKTDADVFPEEQALALRGNDLLVLHTGQPQIFEEIVRHPDGEIHTYLSHKFPLRDADGKIYALCGISTDISERKLVEKRLQESELRWKFALEGGGDGVWDWDLQGGQVYLSPKCVQILGFGKQDSKNNYRNWQATIHPEDLGKMTEDLQAHLNAETERFSNEHRIKLSDGQWRWILTRGVVIGRDENGKAIRMIGTQTDISERKQMQWLQLAKIVDGSPEAMLLVSENGLIKLANAPAAKIFAYPLEALIGLDVDELVPKAARGEHMQRRAEFMQENKARPMSASRSLTGLRRDGQEFPVEISLTPIDIDNQRATIVSVLDISERKRVEHDMQLMSMIHQAIGEAVMVADASNHIIAINEAFTRLTGYSEQEVLGKSTDLLKSGLHGPDFYQTMWHSLTQTGHWQGEIWNKRKNGDIYHEWLVINTIYGRNGEVERRVAMFSEITEQKQIEQKIWLQANFDPLTKLSNRCMFQDRLNQELKKAQRDGKNLALMLLDLDRFKEINDTLGHGVGDILLQEAAKRIVACVRLVDTVSRLGGDEFTVILGELESENSADRVAQAIVQKLAEPFDLGDERVYISASIGITFYPQDAQESEQLIKNADQAMYAAKQQGRNRYSFFTDEMEKAAQNRMRMVADLRQAVVNQEFVLFYQPIMDLNNGSLLKAEALIRWQHPQRGMVSPAEFIPLAEETGLIIDIGDWVFRTAVQQVAEWRQRFQPDFKISINQSPVQFDKQSIDGLHWIDYLHDMGLSGQSLVVEITEGLLLDAKETVQTQLYAYRDAGIQVALDDFGVGYSSLAYLKKFDIDFLKIDQSFTRNLAAGSSDLALCEAIIVMAHKLGLEVVAEGIETSEQMALLQAAGCDYAQGYLFARPLPAADFAALFDADMQHIKPASKAPVVVASSIARLFNPDGNNF